jgi:ribosomal protein S18 acetylase RimI-like enzyme
MTELPEALFANPVWHSLHGPHRHLAIVAGDACRYPADVSPFAAIKTPELRALSDLRLLLEPGDFVWIVDYGRTAPGLNVVESLDCVQMVWPEHLQPPARSGAVRSLSPANSQEMVCLTDAAFPGFFRPRTYRMGSYCGIRVTDQLVAMGGERLRLEGYPELSGICTHPAHRGKGFASDVIAHIVRCHRRDGLRSWLHVGALNAHAIDLYTFLGFERVRSLRLHRIVRAD